MQQGVRSSSFSERVFPIVALVCRRRGEAAGVYECVFTTYAILGRVGATLQPFATWNVLSAPLLIGPRHLDGFSDKETCPVWSVFLLQIVTST